MSQADVHAADQTKGPLPNRLQSTYVRCMSCQECGIHADERAFAWRAYRGDVPGEDDQPTVLLYCPECAEREFGPPRTPVFDREDVA